MSKLIVNEENWKTEIKKNKTETKTYLKFELLNLPGILHFQQV